MFRVCICGCRYFNDYELLKNKCLYYLQNKLPNVIIVSGGCSGADLLGEKFAREYNLKIERFNADWNKYGLSAGPRRNEEMVKISDAAIAFWDGKSKGTNHTINFCKQYNKPCKIVMI